MLNLNETKKYHLAIFSKVVTFKSLYYTNAQSITHSSKTF